MKQVVFRISSFLCFSLLRSAKVSMITPKMRFNTMMMTMKKNKRSYTTRAGNMGSWGTTVRQLWIKIYVYIYIRGCNDTSIVLNCSVRGFRFGTHYKLILLRLDIKSLKCVKYQCHCAQPKWLNKAPCCLPRDNLLLLGCFERRRSCIDDSQRYCQKHQLLAILRGFGISN